jgi:hypothetical protein
MTPLPVRVKLVGIAPPNSPLRAFSGVISAYALVAVTVVFTELAPVGGGDGQVL